ncbi:MAG: GntR family transcriptional regulator [Oscillospiraceae bacterium]|nr:GntR family transcriptional regulator [Oscillospiraceae bacterium]
MPAEEFLYSIDRSSIVPLYYQLKMCILDLIKDGVLHEGDNIASENELCENLGISRPTVRQCLNELVSEGYLTRQRGKGTFVSRARINAQFLNKLHTFGEEMRAGGMVPSTKVLFLGHIPGFAAANEQMGLPADATLIHLRRLRFADQDPILIQDTYLSYEKYEKLLDIDFGRNSLYDTLDRLYGVHIRRVQRSIGACNAIAKESKLLGIKNNAALCIVTTTAFSEQDEPVEYTVSRYRGDKVKFSVELYR